MRINGHSTAQEKNGNSQWNVTQWYYSFITALPENTENHTFFSFFFLSFTTCQTHRPVFVGSLSNCAPSLNLNHAFLCNKVASKCDVARQTMNVTAPGFCHWEITFCSTVVKTKRNRDMLHVTTWLSLNPLTHTSRNPWPLSYAVHRGVWVRRGSTVVSGRREKRLSRLARVCYDFVSPNLFIPEIAIAWVFSRKIGVTRLPYPVDWSGNNKIYQTTGSLL